MNVLALLLFAAIPPDAPPTMPPDAPPVEQVAAIPDATGEPTVTVLPCQCGDACECDPCECPGCPHRKAVATTERRPPLTIVTAFAGCAPCNRFKSDAIPKLKAAGWVEGRDFAVYTMPLGTVPMPSFSWRQNSFGDGYGVGVAGWNKWRAELAEAMGVAAKPVESVRVTHEAQRHDVAKPVQTQVVPAGHHAHRCNSCGTVWTHDGSGDHYREHSCPQCGRYQNVIYRDGATQSAYRGCSGAGCSGRSGGLFGWGLFR